MKMKVVAFWSLILGIIVLSALFAPILAPYSPNDMDMESIYVAPDQEHLLGTDRLGRDVLSRLLYGGRVTLTVAGVSVLISLVLAVIYGGVSGYAGGIVDAVMMRILDAFLSIPSLVLVLALQAVLQGGMWGLIFVIGITGWFSTARIVRSEFIRLKEMEFVHMARMLGTPSWKIITSHLLMNSMPAVFIITIYNFAGAVFIEVSLSFLGIGVSPDIPSWGNMMNQAQMDLLVGAWWIGVFPGLLIFLSILAINFIGEEYKKPQGGYHHAHR